MSRGPSRIAGCLGSKPDVRRPSRIAGCPGSIRSFSSETSELEREVCGFESLKFEVWIRPNVFSIASIDIRTTKADKGRLISIRRGRKSLKKKIIIYIPIGRESLEMMREKSTDACLRNFLSVFFETVPIRQPWSQSQTAEKSLLIFLN